MLDNEIWKKLNRISEQEANLCEDVSEDFDFDDEDTTPPTKEQLDFANDVRKVLQDLIDGEVDNISESFKSRSKLVQHFNSHCLGLSADRQSRRSNVFYDFQHVNQYKDREDNLNAKIQILCSSSKNLIPSLENTDEVVDKFWKFFRGNQCMIFTSMCGFRRGADRVILVLHSYSSDVTENYRAGNTVDLLVLNSNMQTLTMYPVDANYLENKINSIIRSYNINDISPLKINH